MKRNHFIYREIPKNNWAQWKYCGAFHLSSVFLIFLQCESSSMPSQIEDAWINLGSHQPLPYEWDFQNPCLQSSENWIPMIHSWTLGKGFKKGLQFIQDYKCLSTVFLLIFHNQYCYNRDESIYFWNFRIESCQCQDISAWNNLFSQMYFPISCTKSILPFCQHLQMSWYFWIHNLWIQMRQQWFKPQSLESLSL